MCTNNVNKYKYFSFWTSGWAPPLMVPTLTSGKFICKFCKKMFQSNENLKQNMVPFFILFFNVFTFLFHVKDSLQYLQQIICISWILNWKNLKLKDIINMKKYLNIIYLTHQEVSSMMLMKLLLTEFQFDSHLTKINFVNSWHFLFVSENPTDEFLYCSEIFIYWCSLQNECANHH